MNERRLRAFLLVAECGSFSKAAALSYISTPAMVRQINMLEESTGLQLFERTPQGVYLTKAGEKFYQSAKQILLIYEDALDQCKAEQGRTVLTIAYDVNLDSKDFRRACFQYSLRHPEVTIHFTNCIPNNINEELSSENWQILVGMDLHKASYEDCEFTPIREQADDFCIILACETERAGSWSIQDPQVAESVRGITAKIRDKDLDKVIHEPVIREQEIKVMGRADNFDRYEFYNDLFAGRAVIMPSSFAESFQDIKVIHTGIPAGTFGMLTKKKPNKEVREFMLEIIGKLGG